MHIIDGGARCLSHHGYPACLTYKTSRDRRSPRSYCQTDSQVCVVCPFRCDRGRSRESAVGTATTLRARQLKDHVQFPIVARYSETHPVSCSTDKGVVLSLGGGGEEQVHWLEA